MGFLYAIDCARKTLFAVDPYGPRLGTGPWPRLSYCGSEVKIRYLCANTSEAIKSGVEKAKSSRRENFEARWVADPEFCDCAYFIDDLECWTVGQSTSSSLPITSDYARSLRAKYEDLWLRAIEF